MNTTTCYLIQNQQLLINEIPVELQNLSYGIYPNDITYNDDRFIYNKLFNYFPHAVYYPESDKDISYLIKNLVNYNLKFAIRCGGHAYEPASLSEGYIIDVSKINYIKIDSYKKSVKVGSGANLGYLINTLAEHDFITPTGEASCVGISGLSLAGGKGLLTRLYGMVCDNILSLKIVNYKGKIIKASLDENQDLFYALKGAGNGNFGVVTEIELKIYNDIFVQIEKLTWNWNSKEAKIILELYQKFITKIPNYISTELNMTYNNGSATFTITFYKFSKKPFKEIIDFKNLYNPTITINRGYYSKLTDVWVSYDTGMAPPFSKMKSTMIFKEIRSSGINILINSIDNLLKTNYQLNYQLNFSQLGGEVVNGNSSYFPKTAIVALTIFISWTSVELTDFSKKYVNDLYKKIEYYTSIYLFPNMIDYDISNYMEKYYGSNKNKLIEIKIKYDPNNIFSWRQSIPVIENV